MINDIYSYIETNFGIKITDYQFKRDYIQYPLKKLPVNTPTGYKYEIPFKDDLEYLYNSINLSKNDLSKLFNTSIPFIERKLKYYGIFKNKKSHYDLISNIKLKKYGNKGYHNIEKMLQTCQEKYGASSYFKSEKYKTQMNEFLKANNVCNPFQMESSKIKAKKTKLEKYGDEYYSNREKYKQTCLKKYGCEYPQQNAEINKKGFITKAKRHSMGKSKIEDDFYNKLILIFKDVKRQYYSEKYPFPCDFYITDIDLYIEYQGYIVHGNEPYMGTDEQRKKVELLKLKNSDFYNNVIYYWTIRDPLKRETAKKNNLNWLEFFNKRDFDNWIKNYLDNL